MMGHLMIGRRTGSRHAGGLRVLALAAAVAGIGLAGTACSSIQNMAPDWSQFRLPDSRTFVPTSVSAYSGPISKTAPVGPADLVDAQGLCAGMAAPAPSSTEAPSARPPDLPAQGSVSLEMTECDVVRALGRPQSTEIGGGASGARDVTMNFMTGERAGIYHFSAGRLVSIERGAEPPPAPVVAKKPPAKKTRKPQTPPA